MNEAVTIRLHYRDNEGIWQDDGQDYSLEDFAGFLPAVGDIILEPGVPSNLDRREPKNRLLMKVVDRVFNARDMSNYVVLVVDKAAPTDAQKAVC